MRFSPLITGSAMKISSERMIDASSITDRLRRIQGFCSMKQKRTLYSRRHTVGRFQRTESVRPVSLPWDSDLRSPVTSSSVVRWWSAHFPRHVPSPSESFEWRWYSSALSACPCIAVARVRERLVSFLPRIWRCQNIARDESSRDNVAMDLCFSN